MVGPGHHCAAARGEDSLRHRGGVRSDDDLPDSRFRGAAPNMDDHWHAMDVGHWLAWQTARCHPSRDEDKRVHAACLDPLVSMSSIAILGG